MKGKEQNIFMIRKDDDNNEVIATKNEYKKSCIHVCVDMCDVYAYAHTSYIILHTTYDQQFNFIELVSFID